MGQQQLCDANLVSIETLLRFISVAAQRKSVALAVASPSRWTAAFVVNGLKVA
jgi:hypothetical protein